MEINIVPIDRVRLKFKNNITRVNFKLVNYELGEDNPNAYISFTVFGSNSNASGQVPLNNAVLNKLALVEAEIKQLILTELQVTEQIWVV